MADMDHVLLPGGMIAQFPADLPEADRQRAINDYISRAGGMPPAAAPQAPPTEAPQMEGIGRLPAYVGSRLAKGALEGAGIIGDLGNLGQGLATKYINDPIRHALGLRDPVVPRDLLTGQEQSYPGAAGKSLQQLFPGARPEQLPDYLEANRDWLGPAPRPRIPLSSESLVGLGRSAGVIDRPDLQPQNAGERYLGAGAEGLGSMLPYAPLAIGGAAANAARAAPSTIATLLRGGAQGVGGGLGGELAASQVAPNDPWAPYLRAGGAVLGGLTGAGAANVGGRLSNAISSAPSPVTQAYRNLGIDTALAGDVTGSPLLQQIQTAAGKMPGGAGRMQATSDRVMGQWGNAVEDTASSLGTARTTQEAGTALQMEGKGWLNRFATDSKKAWNEVDMHVPQSTPMPLTNYARTLSDIQTSMPGAPATAQVLQSPLSGKLLDSLVRDIQKGPLTWQDARAIRTKIGEKLAEPQLVGDTSYGELKRLYGALSKDIDSVVTARGPAAQQAFADATNLTRTGHDFIENTLSKVLRGNQIAPERAANTALGSGGAGGTFLQDIRDQMPQAADELAAYKLRDMALARAGQQTGSMSRPSPNAFLTDRANLSREAEDALFAHPTVAQRMDDLSTVAGSMRGTERYLNTSNTATTQMMNQALNLAAPLAGAGGYYGGGARGLALALAPWATGQAAARLTSTPALTRFMAAPPAARSPAGGLAAGGALYPWLRPLLP